MRDEDLTAICDRTKKKQTKPEFQLGCFPWKARVITRRWMQLLNNSETFFVICCVTARTKKCISSGLHSSPILYFDMLEW